MKNSAVQIISLVFGTVLAVAAQDLSPALVGVKPPFIIVAALFTAFHAPLAVLKSVAPAPPPAPPPFQAVVVAAPPPWPPT